MAGAVQSFSLSRGDSSASKKLLCLVIADDTCCGRIYKRAVQISYSPSVKASSPMNIRLACFPAMGCGSHNLFPGYLPTASFANE